MTSDPEISATSAGAAWLSGFATIAAVLLLVSLHFLSPEFSPSWRVVSEYALGRYPWVLSLMFLSLGIATWTSAAALWSQVVTTAGRVAVCLLAVSGCGGALASVFDVNHPVGHGIAGLIGILVFPVAAIMLSVILRRREEWRGAARTMFWLAHLNWISIVLLIITLAIMTVQMMHLNGGRLPAHAPKALPPGVFGGDGWADRLIIASNCAWLFVAARRVILLRGGRA